MGEVAIRVDGLSKLYHVGHGASYFSLRESLARLPGRLLGRREAADHRDELWALRDVSFEVRRGEVLGVIGRNGAGKSTLLKILSRITRPTAGRAEVWGRVGSLLEVGTGFHPELTGRENVWLYGAILGLGRDEIRRKFDSIVAFSEVERFLDTPVKHYSTGMQVRLAFSVAAHLEPEVLLVDEVLSVGDTAFQRKCLAKAGSIASEGRTVLFVSHDMAAVQRLCQRAVLLNQGCVETAGEATQVVECYLAGADRASTVWRRSTPSPAKASFEQVALGGVVDGVLGPITTAGALAVDLVYTVRQPLVSLQLSVDLLDAYDQVILVTAPIDASITVDGSAGRYRARVLLPQELLLERTYSVRANLFVPVLGALDRVDGLRFTVESAPSFTNATPQTRLGLVGVRCGWELERLAG